MILVTGATGNVGGRLVGELRTAGAEVRAASREPSRAALPDGVEVVAADLTRPETFDAALRGVDGVFLFPVPGHLDAFLEAATNAGVSRVVLLSSSAVGSADSGAIGRTHAACEQAVVRSGLDWTALRPGAFMVNDLNWANALRHGDVVRAPFAGASTAPIDEGDIAAVAARALLEDGHAGQTYELSGPEALTAPERVRLLGEFLGRELRFEELTPDQARAQMAPFMPPGVIDAMLTLFASLGDAPAAVSPTVHDITGRRPTAYSQWLTTHAEAFRSAG